MSKKRKRWTLCWSTLYIVYICWVVLVTCAFWCAFQGWISRIKLWILSACAFRCCKGPERGLTAVDACCILLMCSSSRRYFRSTMHIMSSRRVLIAPIFTIAYVGQLVSIQGQVYCWSNAPLVGLEFCICALARRLPSRKCHICRGTFEVARPVYQRCQRLQKSICRYRMLCKGCVKRSRLISKAPYAECYDCTIESIAARCEQHLRRQFFARMLVTIALPFLKQHVWSDIMSGIACYSCILTQSNTTFDDCAKLWASLQYFQSIACLTAQCHRPIRICANLANAHARSFRLRVTCPPGFVASVSALRDC